MKVTVEEINLLNQPPKLIIDMILVMKDTQHPNIVDFLEAYIAKSNEIWVVREYMEGCTLAEIIVTHMLKEDQIARICLEVRHLPRTV